MIKSFTLSLGTIFLSLIAFSFFAFTPTEEGYQVGDEVESFQLKNYKGKTIDLNKLEDTKGFIVTFTCNHCPYAKMYEDRLIALHEKYADKG